MQPIKTTNAINPAPAKGIQSFPTPVVDDVVISEVVNSWKGDYQKLEYGTLWKDVAHAPNQGSFPEHKLVYQQPTSEDGQWVKRIWVNDRVNQDSYNYAIKYSAGSQEHPIYIRTYVVPRETYGPIKDLTPDPLFPNALLVDEAVQRNEGELDSKYITVTRVYETLPGPTIPTRRYNERGDLETVIVQTVKPNTPPDPDGLLVTGSQVVQEDVSKGVKTTSTVQDHSLLQIKQKKEGLLGETVTTDDIVDPATNPDALSQTIVSSIVEQYTATKARKRTTTASGPTSLSSKSKDGKLLGDVTSTESVVAPSSDPDSPSIAIISSEVRQVDSGKAIKRNVVLNSTPTLSGNQKEQGLLGIKSTTESIVAAGTQADDPSISIISSAVEPIDSVRSRKVTVESSGPTSLSGGQKKEGLLGETIINESIVVAGSQPDALSETVISSIIEPIDSAKSKKTTTTSIGPTTLSQSSKDGKLLGDVTSIRSVVPPNSTPDSPDESVISSEVNQVDSGKAIKTNVILNSTPTLVGDQEEPGLLGRKSTIETIVPSGSQADEISLSIISSSVEPIDSVRSRKVTVESNGPTVLAGSRINERGDVEYKSESIVASNSSPDPDSFFQTSSEVNPIDSAKSKKTTSTVSTYSQLFSKENKEGLLGQTTTTDDIVDPSTPPDQLTKEIISSTVEKISATKARKRTTISSGPNSLTQSRKDGKLLGDVTEVKSIVDPYDLPDSPSGSLISSEVNQVDFGKAIKTNIILNATPTLSGNQKELGLLGNKTTIESIVPAGTVADNLSLDIISSQVEPIDSVRSRKVTVTSDGPTLLSGKENKEGLLGVTQINQSIVESGSDPDNLSQTVISSIIEPIDEYKSKKTTVSSNGPSKLVGQRVNERGEIESVIQEIVPYGTTASIDSVNQTSSQVEPIDSSKSKKITSLVAGRIELSGNDFKTGLLGKTSTTNKIVPPGTQADQITWNGEEGIIESIVKPISSGKSEKITVSSKGPSSINSDSLIDSPLGLVSANIKKSIVKTGEKPSTNNFKTIRDSINPLDSVKSEREKIEVTNWPTNTGVDYDNVLGIPIFYTETIVEPSSYSTSQWDDVQNQDFKPLDQWKSLKRQINKQKISEALSQQYYKISLDIPIRLPDKLLDVIVYYGRSYADGGSYDYGQGVFTGSYNRNQSGQTKSSFAINGDVYFSVQKGFDGTIPGNEHIFFMEIGNDGKIDNGEIINILNQKSGQTYQSWPYLKIRSENLVIITGGKSKVSSESLSESVSINGASRSVGSGSSFDVNVNVNSVTIPETIHPAIQIKQEFIGDAPGNAQLNATYGVRPLTLEQTTPSIFPTGNYLISANVELYKWGFVKISARTVTITSQYV